MEIAATQNWLELEGVLILVGLVHIWFAESTAELFSPFPQGAAGLLTTPGQLCGGRARSQLL